MQLPICAFIACITIILFSLIPKRLTILEYTFLYCVVLSFTATCYTYFELNLHSVTVPRIFTSLLAVAITRLITVPLLIVIAVDALQTSDGKKPQWLVVFAIWFGLTIFDWILNFFKVITYHHSIAWHAIGTLVTYMGFILVAWSLTWCYKRFAVRNVRQI